MDPLAVVLQAVDEPTLADVLPEWVQFPGWRLIVVVIVLGLGAYVSKYVVRLLGRPIAHRFKRQSVAQTLLKSIRVLTILLAGAFGLNVVGIELGNIVLSVTVFSAVLGIVLAPILGSLINGLFLLADQPYEVGDMIELDTGQRGFIDEITLRYTKMFTLDNTFLVIPNSTIRDRDVINYSAEDERTRIQLSVLVTYESDIDKARRLLEDAGRRSDMVVEGGPDIRIGSARYPAAPRAYIDQYADHGISITLRYWAKKPYKLGTVRSEVLTNLGQSLAEDGDGVEMAYPHQHLVFDETSGVAQVELGNGTGRNGRGDGAHRRGDAVGRQSVSRPDRE
ncbi:mechanosensitive ion channel protein [Salinigranum rubrum]|uniref:Mechanosensitive ion channel protein n=1 Tax=Salinigranum rubrum TaxID=755307 RepID=A0A2I8VK13_9EURY|nr:mechanosensitive ion channel family protein [Salinigranum rubrum]AUV82273.1 mechanosensitive ion channel protein [Salinigranum rubrum]